MKEEKMNVNDFNEMAGISRYVFKKYFSKFKHLKDDLIQSGIIALWRADDKYDSKKSKYITFAVRVCKSAMYQYLRKEYNNSQNLGLDVLDFEISYACQDFEEDLMLQQSINTLINKFYKCEEAKRIKKILCLKVAGYTNEEIGKRFCITNQAVSFLINKLRKKIQSFGGLNSVLES